MSKTVSSLDSALAAFMEGGRIHHAGKFLSDTKMATRGLIRTDEGVDYIDRFSPNARDVLIPLLCHEDDAVRVTAASALIASHPELALPVINEIDTTCVTEAHLTAGLILTFKEVFGEYVMGVCNPDPRYPVPQAKTRI